MEIILADIGLLLLILFTVFVIIGSFIYFKTTKNQYRWIKLCWGLEMIVYLGILLWTKLGGHTTVWIQYLFALLPVTALAYGVVISFARKKESRAIQLLEERLNGELEKWVTEQLSMMNPEE